MRTKNVVVYLIYFVMALPFSVSAQSRCIELFSLSQSSTEVPRTQVRVQQRFFGTREDVFLQKTITELEPLLTAMKVPSEVRIDIRDQTAMGIMPMSVGCGMFLEVSRLILIPPKMFANISAAGKNITRTVVQHEFGHYIFFANMGRFSAKWEKWWNLMEHKWIAGLVETFPFIPGMPSKMIEISTPYQEVFADLLTVVSQNKPNAMKESLEALSASAADLSKMTSEEREKSIKERKETSLSTIDRKFDDVFLKSRWMEKEEHGMLAPVRIYLWETYFSNLRNSAHRAQMIDVVFQIMAKEIIERTENKELEEMSPTKANMRLLRALHEGMAEFRR